MPATTELTPLDRLTEDVIHLFQRNPTWGSPGQRKAFRGYFAHLVASAALSFTLGVGFGAEAMDATDFNTRMGKLAALQRMTATERVQWLRKAYRAANGKAAPEEPTSPLDAITDVMLSSAHRARTDV